MLNEKELSVVAIGDKLPDFELINQDGQQVKLSDYRGQKLVIFAFPKANTLGCNQQACNFRDDFPLFESANAAVLGISTDSVDDLSKWKQSKKLTYDLLSDPDHRVLEMLGAWNTRVLGLIPLPIAARSYWVIDEAGVLIDMKIGIGPGASVNQALAAVNAVLA